MHTLGSRVLARWPGERCWWYPGVVCGIEGDRFIVQFDDGDRSIVHSFDIKPLTLERGTIVQARLDRQLRYVPDVMVLEQQDQALHLRFPDGTEEWSSIALIRVDLGVPLEGRFSAN